jgi:hypothetical protein
MTCAPQFSGARTQFNALGEIGCADLGRIIARAYDEMSRLELAWDAAPWVESARGAMEAIIRTLSLPPVQFSLLNATHEWPVLVSIAPNEDPGAFEVVFHPCAIARHLPLQSRLRELMRQVWRRPLQFLVHHNDGLIQNYILYDVLRGLRRPSPSCMESFLRGAAQACGIEDLVFP